jgi:hypothetical protein
MSDPERGGWPGQTDRRAKLDDVRDRGSIRGNVKEKTSPWPDGGIYFRCAAIG